MSEYNMQGAAYRVLSLRLDEDTRAQLEVLAQLNIRSVTEECRLGLVAWVERSKTDPKVLARAERVRAEIEQEARTKRNAIAAVLGTNGTEPDTETTDTGEDDTTEEEGADAEATDEVDPEPETEAPTTGRRGRTPSRTDKQATA